jgi:hypothetical protein
MSYPIKTVEGKTVADMRLKSMYWHRTIDTTFIECRNCRNQFGTGQYERIGADDEIVRK